MPHIRICALLLSALGLALLDVSAVRAGPSEDAPLEYLRATAQAAAEYDAGNWNEMREECRRAREAWPNARTDRCLAIAEFELRNYGESARWCERALSSTVRPLERRLRRQIRELLERAKRYLGELHVEIDSQSAAVMIDGEIIDLGPSGSVALEVGDHTIEVVANGRAPEKRVVRVQGGERAEVRFDLADQADESRPTSRYTTATNTVRDNARGLTWQRTSPSEAMSQAAAASYCEQLELAHLSEWRLPTIYELVSLVEGVSAPAIYQQTFSNEPAQKFWTSTPHARAGNAWVVDFTYGNSIYYETTSPYRVRCVHF